MISFIIRRLLQAIPVMLLVGAMAFLMIHLIPGNPAEVMLGSRANEDAIKALTEKMGYDQPLYIQFEKWLAQLIKGDFGFSVYSGQPVMQVILSHVEPSLLLASISTVLYALLGISIGIISAVKQNTWIDQLSMVTALTFASVPNFWLCLILMLVFSSILHWLPSSGYPGIFVTGNLSNFRYLVLPAIAITLPSAALIARLSRSAMLDIIRMDYIITARSKGLQERVVIVKHALRNVLNPIITILAVGFGDLVVFESVTETVFNIPGLGRLIVLSLLQRNYPVLQGLLILTAGLYVFLNLIADIMYGVVDPRIRYD